MAQVKSPVGSLFKKIGVALGLLILAGILIWWGLTPLRSRLAGDLLNQAQTAFNEGDWESSYNLSWRTLLLGYWKEDNLLLLSRSAHEAGTRKLARWFYGQLFELTKKPLFRAEAAVRSENWEESPVLLRQAAAEDPSAALPWFYLVFLENEPKRALNAHLRQGYMRDELLEIYQAKEVFSASEYERELVLARLAWQLGERALALFLSQRATEQDPLFSCAWAELGRFYFLDGQNPLAKKAVETALLFDPLNSLALQLKEKME